MESTHIWWKFGASIPAVWTLFDDGQGNEYYARSKKILLSDKIETFGV